jgi:type IV secretory pathway TraG/TraD family ATPase VirD4
MAYQSQKVIIFDCLEEISAVVNSISNFDNNNAREETALNIVSFLISLLYATIIKDRGLHQPWSHQQNLPA